MKKYLNELKNIYNTKVLITSLVIWGAYFISGIQGMFFHNAGIKRVIFFKFLHFIFIYFVVYFLFHIFTNRKKENYRHGIIMFSAFCLIAFLLLFLIWPGAWSWDDILILNSAQLYNLYPWQHFFSSIFYIISLETIPFSTGVIIVQILIIAAIIGYCIPNISNTFFKKEHKIFVEIILFISMLFFPILSYLFSGYRMILYSFLELLLLVKFILIYKNTETLSFNNLLFTCVLTIIVGSWRTEGIYYILGIILFLIMIRDRVSKRTMIVVPCIVAIMILGIGKINNYLINTNNYSITAIMEPLQALIKKADKEADKEELEAIGKVINIQVIYDNPTWSGEAYYWANGGIVKKGYSDEEYSGLMRSFLSLYMKYPMVGLNAVFNIFWKTSGVVINNGKTLQKNVTEHTLQIFDMDSMYGNAWNKVDSLFKTNNNLELRNSVIRILGCLDKNNKVNWFYYIEWNVLLPLVLVVLLFLYKLIKKDWLFVFIITLILIRLPLVLLTAPVENVMYYLSIYLCSWFFIFLMFLQIVFRRKDK